MLWRCPDGSVSCPGNTLVVASMNPQVPGLGGVTDACAVEHENGTNTTGTKRGGPPCQCAIGSTGLLCHACQNGKVGTPNFVMSGVAGMACMQCQFTFSESWTFVSLLVVVLITFGIIIKKIAAVVTQPSNVEGCFARAFEDIEHTGAQAAVDRFFGTESSRKGVTREQFVAACEEMLRNDRSGGGEGKADQENINKLWRAIDCDGDGTATMTEFVHYIYNIKGKDGCCATVACKLWRRFYSIKNVTMRTCIITHFQLSSSILRSFPDLNPPSVVINPSGNPSIGGKPTTNATLGVETSVLSEFSQAFTSLTGYLGDINVAIFDVLRCFVGPRHVRAPLGASRIQCSVAHDPNCAPLPRFHNNPNP